MCSYTFLHCFGLFPQVPLTQMEKSADAPNVVSKIRQLASKDRYVCHCVWCVCVCGGGGGGGVVMCVCECLHNSTYLYIYILIFVLFMQGVFRSLKKE